MHRLPLVQSDRLPPEGVMSYDQWRADFLFSYLRRLRGPCDYSRRQVFNKRAEHQGRDVMGTHSSEPVRPESEESQEMPVKHGWRERRWRREMEESRYRAPSGAPLIGQLPDPITTSDANALSCCYEAPLMVLPTTFRGPCYLDVDLAFVGLHDLDHGVVTDYCGTLAFRIDTLRVPPMNDGSVRIQVCEVHGGWNPDQNANFLLQEASF